MTFQKQYIEHLEKEGRITHVSVTGVDGESILNISLTKGLDCIIHDKIDMQRDTQRLAEFEAAVGDYGEWDGLLDRRVGLVFDERWGKRIVGYVPSFFPLSFQWDGVGRP